MTSRTPVRRLLVLLSAAAVGLGGAACGQSAPVTQPSSSTSPSTTSSPTSTAEQLVMMQRTGGVGGVRDTVSVTAGTGGQGVAVVSTRATARRTVQLSESDLAAVRDLVDRAAVDQLQPTYPPKSGRSDSFQYVVIVGDRTVVCHEAAVPPSLKPLVDRLTSLIGS